MRFIVKLGFCLLLCGGSGWSSADKVCLDSLTGLPKGSYVGKHCEGDRCLEPEFHYDAETDQISLRKLLLIGTFEKAAFEVIFEAGAFDGIKILPDACAWIEAGFDIDMHVKNFSYFQFMLIPPQIEPDYEIAEGKETRNKLDETDNFLMDIFVKNFRHSCSQFRLYVQSDVIFYRCSAEHRAESSFSVLPYFYQFQKKADVPLMLENKNGILSVIKVLRIKNKFSQKEIDFQQEIDRQCNVRRLEKVKVSGGVMCHSEQPELLSKNLRKSDQHTVFIEPISDYAVLHNCGDKSHLDVLMGVNHCFNRGLKLDYLKRHHRLFCEPDKYREPQPGVNDDHEEL